MRPLEGFDFADWDEGFGDLRIRPGGADSQVRAGAVAAGADSAAAVVVAPVEAGGGEGAAPSVCSCSGAFSDHFGVRLVVDLRGDVAQMSGTIG
jgi:hypothetical protein